jgi:hypothetical protein
MEDKNQVPDFLPEELPEGGPKEPGERAKRSVPGIPELHGIKFENGKAVPCGAQEMVAVAHAMADGVLQSAFGVSLKSVLDELSDRALAVANASGFSERARGRFQNLFREFSAEALRAADGDPLVAATLMGGVCHGVQRDGNAMEALRHLEVYGMALKAKAAEMGKPIDAPLPPMPDDPSVSKEYHSAVARALGDQ